MTAFMFAIIRCNSRYRVNFEGCVEELETELVLSPHISPGYARRRESISVFQKCMGSSLTAVLLDVMFA